MNRRFVRAAVAALGAATVALVLSLVVGRASSLSTGSGSLGANGATVGRCDTDGVTTIITVVGTSTNVTGVTVSGVAAACAGQTLYATAYNGTTTSSGSATVPSGGGTVVVTFVALPGTDSTRVDVSIGA